MKISASLLGANPLCIEEEIKKVTGVDFLHFDVMDGHFVNNLSFGTQLYKNIRKYFPEIPIEVHLMVDNPTKIFQLFPKPYSIIFHPRFDQQTKGLIKSIHHEGIQAGLALNPNEFFDTIQSYADDIDQILLMSVYPGYGGQKFIPETVQKIRDIRSKFNKKIEVDGGINGDNAKDIIKAGADTIVSGSYLFSGNSQSILHKLRNI